MGNGKPFTFAISHLPFPISHQAVSFHRPVRTVHALQGQARMRVRLTRKLAEQIDGVDLSAHRVGDVFELSSGDAGLLVAEQWAVPVRRDGGPAENRGELRRAVSGADSQIPASEFVGGPVEKRTFVRKHAVAADTPRRRRKRPTRR